MSVRIFFLFLNLICVIPIFQSFIFKCFEIYSVQFSVTFYCTLSTFSDYKDCAFVNLNWFFAKKKKKFHESLILAGFFFYNMHKHVICQACFRPRVDETIDLIKRENNAATDICCALTVHYLKHQLIIVKHYWPIGRVVLVCSQIKKLCGIETTGRMLHVGKIFCFIMQNITFQWK